MSEEDTTIIRSRTIQASPEKSPFLAPPGGLRFLSGTTLPRPKSMSPRSSTRQTPKERDMTRFKWCNAVVLAASVLAVGGVSLRAGEPTKRGGTDPKASDKKARITPE